MKQINTYITEKLRLTAKPQYTCQPKHKHDLRKIIRERIKNDGPDCDLNDIDVSKITDMSHLFDSELYGSDLATFNGDISQWNVSNVTNMTSMFDGCTAFNSDISMWKVSNVKDMMCMFRGCKNFMGDLSKWDTSSVKNMMSMFDGCEKFNSDISSWDVSNVEDFDCMFINCKSFTQNLNSWNISNTKRLHFKVFDNCPAPKPDWYKKHSI